MASSNGKTRVAYIYYIVVTMHDNICRSTSVNNKMYKCENNDLLKLNNISTVEKLTFDLQKHNFLPTQ